jgi:hypothetical protein
VACGSRLNAYESFCTAIANNEAALLLVDSEASVADAHQNGSPEQWKPWDHLKVRDGDGWGKPNGASDTDCHLMVQMMETWFLGDRRTLQNFFGQYFQVSSLPSPINPIEVLTKQAVLEGLLSGTRHCKPKGQYSKGEHSFTLLKELDPSVVMAASPWAMRFVEILKKKMDA